MKKSLMFVALLFLIACGHAPDAGEKAKAQMTAGVVLEIDGIRVYRFTDGDNYHYFAVPRSGAAASTFADWTRCYSCGKNCTRCVQESDDIPTMATR